MHFLSRKEKELDIGNEVLVKATVTDVRELKETKFVQVQIASRDTPIWVTEKDLEVENA